MRSHIMWRGAAPLAFATALLSCGGGGDGGGGGNGGGGPAAPTARIQIALSPATLSVQQGGTATVTVTLTRTNFAGAVVLTLDAPPAGISGSFTPASVTGDNATLSLSVATTTAAASYSLTIRASGSGISEQTATLALTVTAAPGTIAVTAAPSAISLLAGGSTVNVTFTYSRTNYAGAISLAHVQGLPQNMVVGDVTGPTTGNTAVLAFAASASAPPGTYTTVWEARGTGATPGRVTVTVTVSAPVGSIALTASPASVTTLAGGASVSSDITVTRNNFAGMVSFAATSGIPVGDFDFTIIATTGNATTVRITVSVGTPPGTYPFTVSASAPGIVTASVPVQITVVPATQVDFQFCSAADTPIFFAAKDGDAPWTPVAPTRVGSATSYRFGVSSSSSTASVAFVQPLGANFGLWRASSVARSAEAPAGGSWWNAHDPTARVPAALDASNALVAYQTIILHGVPSELAIIGARDCSTVGTKTVRVPVAGVAAGARAYLSMVSQLAYIFTGGTSVSPLLLSGVPNGTVDLAGSRVSIATGALEKVLIERDLNPVDGSSVPFVADFEGVRAFAPASATATVSNALGDSLRVSTAFFTARGAYAPFGVGPGSSSALTRSWLGAPNDRWRIGDLHIVAVGAEPFAPGTSEYRFSRVFVPGLFDVPLRLGARMPSPTVSRVGSTGRRIRVAGNLPVEYRDLLSVYYAPVAGGNVVRILLTRGYLRGQAAGGNYDVVTPDILGLPGFPVAADLSSGAWTVGVSGDGWGAKGILRPDRVPNILHVGGITGVTFNMP